MSPLASRLRTLALRSARAARASRLGLVVTGVSLAIFLTLLLPARGPGQSDGHYMWLFARSIVFDHDLEFKNDYALCGDPHHRGRDWGTGHPANPFYIGPSLTWAPVLWVAKHTLHLPDDAPDSVKQACVGPLATITLSVGAFIGALTIWLMYRIARRFADDGPSALAAGLLGLTSSLPEYAGLQPEYSHAYDAFWAAVVILLTLRASERPESVVRWALAGVAVGIGLLQRPVSVVHGLVPAVVAAWTLRGRWRTLVIAWLALGAGAILFGILPQMLIFKYLYGKFWVGSPHGRHYMQFGHAHPLLVLFAPHGGFFYTTPAAWLAVLGIVLGARDRSTRALILSIFGACAAATWLSAAASDWHGSGTFGARRLTSALPLLAPPMAIVLFRASRWLRARPRRATTALGLAVLVPMAFTILGAVQGFKMGRIGSDTGASQEGLYGEGEKAAWSFVDEQVGDLAILPAEIVFHLRYGLPMNAFREASTHLFTGDINLTAHARSVTGLESTPEGMRFSGRRATVVFATEWPHPTRFTVRGRAQEPTRLRVGYGSWIGTRWWGEVTLDRSGRDAAVAIPPGGSDSGIVEVVFERVEPGQPVLLTGLQIDPVYEPGD
jgi:hypothetical protein